MTQAVKTIDTIAQLAILLHNEKLSKEQYYALLLELKPIIKILNGAKTQHWVAENILNIKPSQLSYFMIFTCSAANNRNIISDPLKIAHANYVYIINYNKLIADAMTY